MLKIYNSITRNKEIFTPINKGKASIYVCGITVYDYCHIGHARTSIAFDIIVRYLRYLGYEVKYIRNITDIDDKIINRAKQNNEEAATLALRFTEAMHADMHALNLLPPDEEPRATQFIPHMIELVKKLEQKDFAYKAENGDVYYNVHKFNTYGYLSHRNLEDLQSGARIEINEAKQNPLDFVLWKAAKEGEPSWNSPWGKGRPGWHLECSAMAMHYLGETFDIHGGGCDLLFPHHENERAQSEAVTGQTFANIWMHTGFLQINKEKMAKSLGNFITVNKALTEIHPEVLRFFMISSHYRSPLEYSLENISASRNALERFYIALRGLPSQVSKLLNSDFEKRFLNAMDDDFNTPEALAVLFDLVKEINKLKESSIEKAAPLGSLLKHLGGVLGLLQSESESFLKDLSNKDEMIDPQEIEKMIAARSQARKDKNWQEADRIRDRLLESGITLEDTSSGTIWRVSRMPWMKG